VRVCVSQPMVLFGHPRAPDRRHSSVWNGCEPERAPHFQEGTNSQL